MERLESPVALPADFLHDELIRIESSEQAVVFVSRQKIAVYSNATLQAITVIEGLVFIG
jgi:hypothetical protein